MFPRLPLTAFALAFLLAPLPAYAQVSEGYDEETTTAPGGVARPEKEPDLSRVEKLIIEKTNEFRREHGLDAVKPAPKLMKTAQDFAAFMARTTKYGHHADGQTAGQRVKEHGYKYCIVAENIAYQYSSRGFETEELARKFFRGWKNSPEHRKNMLDPDVTETGVGVVHSKENGYYYAVQLFARPKSKQIEFTLRNEIRTTVHYKIGGREFTLPPRYSRTHYRCRPPELTFLGADGKGGQKQTLEPRPGETYVVARDGGQLELRRR